MQDFSRSKSMSWYLTWPTRLSINERPGKCLWWWAETCHNKQWQPVAKVLAWTQRFRCLFQPRNRCVFFKRRGYGFRIKRVSLTWSTAAVEREKPSHDLRFFDGEKSEGAVKGTVTTVAVFHLSILWINSWEKKIPLESWTFNIILASHNDSNVTIKHQNSYECNKNESSKHDIVRITTIIFLIHLFYQMQEKKKTPRKRPYTSAMLQSWNKFCFTGGVAWSRDSGFVGETSHDFDLPGPLGISVESWKTKVEMSAKFPGRPVGKPGISQPTETPAATTLLRTPKDIPGLWPAFWLLGNLGF